MFEFLDLGYSVYKDNVEPTIEMINGTGSSGNAVGPGFGPLQSVQLVLTEDKNAQMAAGFTMYCAAFWANPATAGMCVAVYTTSLFALWL